MRFDHAGIVTDDIGSMTDLYASLFDSSIVHEETFAGLRLVFLDLEPGYFELIEPVEAGTVSRYLERHGPGLHHLGVEVNDIMQALESAHNHGIELIDEHPRQGAWGHEVAFLHPSSTGGTLLEFVQH